MVETLVIGGVAVILFYWLRGVAARNRQQRLNELLVPALQHARDKDVGFRFNERVELVSFARPDPVFDELSRFFETPGRIPAALHMSNYEDLKEAVALWKDVEVSMNQRFGIWSREHQLRTEGRREPKPRAAVQAILDQMLNLSTLIDTEHQWQHKNERHKASFDKMLQSLDSSKEWMRQALEYLDYVGVPAEDRGTVARVRAWNAGGFTVLAARRITGALGPLVAGDNAAYVGEWLGEAGDVAAINNDGFKILVRNRHLSIDGQTWDAVISARTGHYVARLGSMDSPI